MARQLTRVQAIRVIDNATPGGITPELEVALSAAQARALAATYTSGTGSQARAEAPARKARKVEMTPEEKAAKAQARALGNMPEWLFDFVDCGLPGWVSVGKAACKSLNKALARGGVAPLGDWDKTHGREYVIPGLAKVAVATHRGEVMIIRRSLY